MSNNEINYKLLCAYKFEGNIEARNELVTRNEKLIHYVFHRFFKGYYLDPDTKADIFDAGVIGLMDAIKVFKVEAYSNLGTFAVSYIRDRMARSLPKDIPFSEYENEETEVKLTDTLVGDYAVDRDRYDTYEFLCTVCTHEQLSIVGMLNRTCNEPYWSINTVAKKLQLPPERVCTSYKAAMETLNQPWLQWYVNKVKGLYVF